MKNLEWKSCQVTNLWLSLTDLSSMQIYSLPRRRRPLERNPWVRHLLQSLNFDSNREQSDCVWETSSSFFLIRRIKLYLLNLFSFYYSEWNFSLYLINISTFPLWVYFECKLEYFRKKLFSGKQREIIFFLCLILVSKVVKIKYSKVPKLQYTAVTHDIFWSFFILFLFSIFFLFIFYYNPLKVDTLKREISWIISK